MPGIHVVVSICPAYTLVSSHWDVKYLVRCNFQLNVCYSADHNTCIYVYSYYKACNMIIKIVVLKIFLKPLYSFTYYVLRYTMQICTCKRISHNINRHEAEISVRPCAWYLWVLWCSSLSISSKLSTLSI